MQPASRSFSLTAVLFPSVSTCLNPFWIWKDLKSHLCLCLRCEVESPDAAIHPADSIAEVLMWFWGIPASPFGQACGLPLAWIGKTWRTGVFQSSSQHTLSILEPKKQLEKLKRHVQASSFPMMSTCHGAHNLLDFSSLCCCHKIWGQVDLLAWFNMPSRRDSHALLISRLWWIFASLLADWEDLVVMLTNTCYSQNINGCQDLQGSGSGRSGSWHGRPRSLFLHHGIWKCYPLLPLRVIPWSQRVCTADLLNATTEAGLLSGRTSLVTWLSKSTGILRESPKELRKGRQDIQDLSWSFATLHIFAQSFQKKSGVCFKQLRVRIVNLWSDSRRMSVNSVSEPAQALFPRQIQYWTGSSGP